jgi:flavin reductase (DIM6/NTAB) family NADH-FMN oxidoreductase RutF
VKKSLGAKTLVYPTPVWCVGTYDSEGNPNVMTAAWGGICCSKPPSVTVSIRKSRHTYKNIIESGCYTISIPSVKYVAEADYYGIVSGSENNKIEKTGLTPVKGEFVDAPYINEFPLILECKVNHSFEIGVHIQFIAEILDVKADESVLNESGRPEMSLVQPIIYDPELSEYYSVGEPLAKAFKVGKKFKDTPHN